MKRHDIKSSCMQSQTKSCHYQRDVNALVEGAKKKLKHVFGFEVVEGAKSELYAGESFTQNTQAKQANQKLYMLRNCLATPPADQDPDAPPLDVEDAAVKTRVQLIELLATPQPTDFSLVLNVLALIALSGFKMKREDLLEALRSLDPPLRRGETLEDLLTKLQTQMYIDDKQEKDEEDQKQTFYLPGLRAEKEVTRRRIVDYAEFVFGERMSAKERSRLLPDEEQDADDDEMQARMSTLRGVDRSWQLGQSESVTTMQIKIRAGRRKHEEREGKLFHGRA